MNISMNRHEEILTQYGMGPRQLEAALLDLSESKLDLCPHADGWSIRAIVHHIADGDDLWKMCIKQAIGHPDSEFVNWYWQVPQDEWAQNWNYSERSIEPSLALFRANRGHIVHLLRATPGAMEKTIRVRWPTIEEQVVQVASIVEGQTQHVTEHVAEIVTIREAYRL